MTKLIAEGLCRREGREQIKGRTRARTKAGSPIETLGDDKNRVEK